MADDVVTQLRDMALAYSVTGHGAAALRLTNAADHIERLEAKVGWGITKTCETCLAWSPGSPPYGRCLVMEEFSLAGYFCANWQSKDGG